MRKTAKILARNASVAVLAAGLALPVTQAWADTAEGKKLSFDRKKGNCLSCHYIEGGESPGDIGPPLVAMKARYPDKAKLRAQIWDATKKNPETIMPPFGRNKILSEEDIDKITEYVYTL